MQNNRRVFHKLKKLQILTKKIRKNKNNESSLSLKPKQEKQQNQQSINRLLYLDSENECLLFAMQSEQISLEASAHFCPLIGKVEVNGFLSSAENSELFLTNLVSLKGNNFLQISVINDDKCICIQESNLINQLSQNVSKIRNKRDSNQLIDKLFHHGDQIIKIYKSLQSENNLQGSQHHRSLSIILFSQIKILDIKQIYNEKNNYWTKKQVQLQNIIEWKNKKKEEIDILVNSVINYQETIQDKQTQQYIHKKKKTILVCGSKNTGKSTLVLYLLNRFISLHPQDQVFLLDTDLGQGLFYFPSTVNLYCLGYKDVILTNLSGIEFIEPLASYFIGEFSPQNYIPNYIQAIKKSMQLFNEMFSESILIINTHGYINNIGEILLYDIQDIVKPENIIIMQGQGETNYIDFLSQHIQNIQQRQVRMTLQDQMQMQENQFQLESFLNGNSMKEENYNQGYNPNIIKFDNFQVSSLNKMNANTFKRKRKDKMMLAYFLQNKINSEIERKQVEIINVSSIINKLQSTKNDKEKGEQIQLKEVINQQENDGTKFPLNQFHSGFAKLNFQLAYQCKIDNFKFIFFESKQSLQNPVQIALNFCGAIVGLFENQIELDNCSGFGFIKDFDIYSKLFYVITPLSHEKLQKICVIVKSSEVDFSKNFFLENQQELIMVSEFSYDIEGNFTNQREINFPFILPKSCGIGNQSFRTRVSNRK